jgi:predicted ATPase
MLNRLSIKNYRAISSLEMNIGGLTVLTGVNGSGKSSVLQATWMCCHALSMALARQIPPQVRGRILARNDLPATMADLCPSSGPPSPFVGAGEAHACVSLDFDNADPLQQVFLEVRPGTGSACSVTLRVTVSKQAEFSAAVHTGCPRLSSGQELTPLLPTALYFPASYGVQAEEWWVPDREVFAALYGGQQKLVLRNMLARLDGAALEELNAFLMEARGTLRVSPRPEEVVNREGRLAVTFAGPNGSFELLSAGDGLTNFITIYAATALCRQRRTPALLLLDEPEIHLSARLQGRVGDLLATAAGTWGAQAIFATHSITMMLLLRDRHGGRIFQMSGGSASALDSQERVILALNECQDLTPFETTSFLKHRRLLFVEGRTDSAILSRCAEVHYRREPARLERVRRWLIRPLTGVGNAGIPAGLAQLLTPQVFSFPDQREPLKIVNVLDRDYSREPTFRVNDQVTHLELLDVVWSRHSIESLFLTSPCLASWLLAALGPSEVGRDDLERIIDAAISDADRDRKLLYDAQDGLRQVLLSRGTKLPDAVKQSRDTADAGPATWQKGKDRAAFILRRVREALPLPLQRRVSNSIADILDAAAGSVRDGDPHAVPEEIRQLLDHLSMP